MAVIRRARRAVYRGCRGESSRKGWLGGRGSGRYRWASRVVVMVEGVEMGAGRGEGGITGEIRGWDIGSQVGGGVV